MGCAEGRRWACPEPAEGMGRVGQLPWGGIACRKQYNLGGVVGISSSDAHIYIELVGLFGCVQEPGAFRIPAARDDPRRACPEPPRMACKQALVAN